MIEIRAKAMPFPNDFERNIHFTKHGHKFQAANAIEYENMADEFMFGAMTITMRECTRANMVHRLRLNIMNRHFGVANIAPAFLKTFYPINGHTMVHYGGSANYFAYECGRTDL